MKANENIYYIEQDDGGEKLYRVLSCIKTWIWNIFRLQYEIESWFTIFVIIILSTVYM